MKSWKDATTIKELNEAGIKGFMFPNALYGDKGNDHLSEEELVAAVKKSLHELEKYLETGEGDFEEITDDY